jgi:hypothetical protein
LPPHAPWLNGWIAEHVRFPKAKNDDQVDAGTQAILHLENAGTNLAQAMQTTIPPATEVWRGPFDLAVGHAKPT